MRPRMGLSLLTAMWALPALALMPPHANTISPGHGAVLTGRIITVQGYTLSNLSEVVTITDGEGDEVAFVADSKCTWVGEGTAPGARQQRCVGRITLLGRLKPKQVVTLKLFRDTHTYTVSPDGVPAFDPEAPRPELGLPGPPRPPTAPTPPAPPKAPASTTAP